MNKSYSANHDNYRSQRILTKVTSKYSFHLPLRFSSNSSHVGKTKFSPTLPFVFQAGVDQDGNWMLRSRNEKWGMMYLRMIFTYWISQSNALPLTQTIPSQLTHLSRFITSFSTVGIVVVVAAIYLRHSFGDPLWSTIRCVYKFFALTSFSLLRPEDRAAFRQNKAFLVFCLFHRNAISNLPPPQN